MRVLSDIKATPEQLAIASINRPGVEIIRGAAGSGKTSTALLRLRSLIGVFVSRQQRMGDARPVRVLVLTFNKTLRGYIEALAMQQIADPSNVDLMITTFGKWAKDSIGAENIVRDELILPRYLGHSVKPHAAARMPLGRDTQGVSWISSDQI